MAEKYDKGEIAEHANVEQHIGAKLRNPLSGLSRKTLLTNAVSFCEEKGLTEHVETFKRGALVAQNPTKFESMPELTENDKDYLRKEQASRWYHPTMLYFTIGLCSIGAAVQGWDQTGSNGANLGFPDAFGIGSGSRYDSWIIGIVNSGPYIGSAALGCWLSDPLNKYFGRRGTIFITALVLIATPIGSAFTQSWQTLFVVRLILGLGMGAKGSTVPILAAENSPSNIRGALTMTWQFWTAFGIFLGFVANVVCLEAFSEVTVWRYQLGSAFIPAIPLMGIFFVPESPRWLMKKGRYQDAFRSYQRLRFTDVQAARDMYFCHCQLQIESTVATGATYWARFRELWTIPRNRRATMAASTVMLAQQMCGINIIAFYSSTVFVNSGFDNRQALYASLGFGAINFLFAIPAFITIDTYGRRTLLLFTFPNMAWSLLAAGLCLLISDDHKKVRLALVALFIYIFAMFYSPGEGPVPFAYSAEVFPLSHREVGMSWAVTVCLGFAAILTITFPAMQDAMTTVGAFGFYAGLNLIAFCLIYCFVPETKQRTLEELDQIFSVPNKVFISYQVKTVLPFWFRKYVFRQHPAPIPPLIAVDDSEEGFAPPTGAQRRAERYGEKHGEKHIDSDSA